MRSSPNVASERKRGSFSKMFGRSPNSSTALCAESPDLGVFRGFAPVNQKWNYGVARRFETVPWTVFYMIPEQSLNAQIAQMTRQKTLFAGVIILIALLAGTLFAAVILKPIGSLSTATESIAGGDLAARVPPGHADELGRLGTSFNSMAEQIEAQATALQKARDELELRVQERTAELMQKSQDLEIQTAERERLAAIAESSDDAIISKDLDGVITTWNLAAERMFGYSRQEVLGKPMTVIIPPDRLDEEPRILAQIIRGEIIDHFETVRIGKDGKPIEVSVTVSPIKDRAGRIIGASKIARDITGRKQAEEAVRQSEARYRTLFDTLIEGFCTIEMIFDADGKAVDYRFLEINPAFEKQTGLHNAQGRLMRDLAPDHEAHWFEIYGKIALTGEPAQFESEAKALGRHYDVCAYRVGGPESRKVAILFNDITERKRAEAAIRESEEHFRFLNDLAEATRTLADPEQIMAVMARMLGEHLRASRCAYADVEKDGEQFTILHDYTDGCASTVGHYQLSLFGARAVATLHSGQTLIIRNVEAELLPGEGADMFNAIGIKAIITCPLVKDNAELEQRVIERTAQLEAANKELEAFSYSVSHDLRAPLRAVDGFSQAVLEDYGPQLPEEGRRYLQTIREGRAADGRVDRRSADLLAAEPAAAEQTGRWIPANWSAASSMISAPSRKDGRSRFASATCRACHGRSGAAEAGLDQPALQRPEIHAQARSTRSSKSAVCGRRARTSISCATTARALTCATRTSCSASSSGCTARRTTRARASAWPSCSGSSTATAGASGPKPPSIAAPPFISPSKEKPNHERNHIR